MKAETKEDGLVHERERIARMIRSGRLELAGETVRRLAAALPGAEADAALVSWLLKNQPGEEAEAWLEALRASPRGGSEAIVQAARAYLALGLLRASEVAEGRGGAIRGVPVGSMLLDVGLIEEAAASLYASLAKAPASGRIALLLANALQRLERHDEARDMYRRALRVAPHEVVLSEIEDPQVRGLAEAAAAFALPGDARPWMPILGFLRGLLPLSAIDPVPGAGFGDGSRAYDLLIAHRGARSTGERLAIRRDLRELAPALFDAMVEAGKLDAT